MYQLNGEERIEEWLSRCGNPAERLSMLEWLRRLATDPVAVASARRDHDRPVYVAEVPDTTAFVSYLVAEQYRTVLILRVVDVPPLKLP